MLYCEFRCYVHGPTWVLGQGFATRPGLGRRYTAPGLQADVLHQQRQRVEHHNRVHTRVGDAIKMLEHEGCYDVETLFWQYDNGPIKKQKGRNDIVHTFVQGFKKHGQVKITPKFSTNRMERTNLFIGPMLTTLSKYQSGLHIHEVVNPAQKPSWLIKVLIGHESRSRCSDCWNRCRRRGDGVHRRGMERRCHRGG